MRFGFGKIETLIMIFFISLFMYVFINLEEKEEMRFRCLLKIVETGQSGNDLEIAYYMFLLRDFAS